MNQKKKWERILTKKNPKNGEKIMMNWWKSCDWRRSTREREERENDVDLCRYCAFLYGEGGFCGSNNGGWKW